MFILYISCDWRTPSVYVGFPILFYFILFYSILFQTSYFGSYFEKKKKKKKNRRIIRFIVFKLHIVWISAEH